jgi:hypothetical protein
VGEGNWDVWEAYADATVGMDAEAVTYRYAPLHAVAGSADAAGMDRGRAEEARWVWMVPTRQQPTDEPTSRPGRCVLRAVRREDEATTLAVACRHIPLHTVTRTWSKPRILISLRLSSSRGVTGRHPSRSRRLLLVSGSDARPVRGTPSHTHLGVPDVEDQHDARVVGRVVVPAAVHSRDDTLAVCHIRIGRLNHYP